MINRLLHILLALNLFVSSLGLMAYEHICSINGTTFSIFFKPQNCCSKINTKGCSVAGCVMYQPKAGVSFNKKPCCEEKTHYKKLNVSATENVKVILSEIQPVFYNPIIGVSYDLNDKVKENEKTVRFYLYKPPPLPVVNLRVLYQSFLC